MSPTGPRRFRTGVVAFLAFGIKQANACLCGALLLMLILGTRFVHPENGAPARYDFLFLAAIVIGA